MAGFCSYGEECLPSLVRRKVLYVAFIKLDVRMNLAAAIVLGTCAKTSNILDTPILPSFKN